MRGLVSCCCWGLVDGGGDGGMLLRLSGCPGVVVDRIQWEGLEREWELLWRYGV